jgi:hypothetical protein
VEEAEPLELVGPPQRPGVDRVEATGTRQLDDRFFASSSSAAMKTSSGWPATRPSTSVPAKVVGGRF